MNKIPKSGGNAIRQSQNPSSPKGSRKIIAEAPDKAFNDYFIKNMAFTIRFEAPEKKK